MISFDFEYYRPTSIDEAIKLFFELDSQGKSPIYYAGGTEIITMARLNNIFTDAVIDIKEIPECNLLQVKKDKIVIGSAVTLNRISETNLFPFLSAVIRRTADHTSRNKITLGGNICGNIPYRETVLPFLSSDSDALIAKRSGVKTVPINSIFNGELKLEKGEFLTRIVTDKNYANFPFEYVKRTKQGKVDYPLVSLACLKKDDSIRMAFSGLCISPFRSSKVEETINDKNIFAEDKLERIIPYLPSPIMNNLQSSAEYRKFVTGNILADVLKKIGGD